MSDMRAKMRVSNVIPNEEFESERLTFTAVCKSDGYPEDGADENNTYAMWTPNAELEMTVTNPALLGKFKIDEEYYLDFNKAG